MICLLGLVVLLPIYYLLVEHTKLQNVFGYRKAIIVGDILGRISGWLFFGFLIGLWISPQPNFEIYIFPTDYRIELSNFKIDILFGLVSCLLIGFASFLGIKGVKDISLKVSETHRPEKIIIEGIYKKIRHPQYLATFLAHLGFSILFSSLFSLLVSPLILIYICFISKKEEIELEKEFGDEYRNYKCKVPMFFPKLT